MTQMTEQWKCKACGFPENFLDTCSLCNAPAPVSVKRGNYPPRAGRKEK